MKTAAYICRGCGIGDRLDTAQLARIAQQEGKADLVREHDFLCSSNGVRTIQDDIARHALTHVAIAACSRRAKTEAFCFPHTALARANLREGVIWSQPPGAEAREAAQQMANDYVRMACAEIKKLRVPEGQAATGKQTRILVVGGGVSGMTAALEIAQTGFEAVIVEKEPVLGGWAAELYRRVPDREPYAEPAPTGVSALIERVSKSSRIEVRLNTTVAATCGAPGRFTVTLATESGATSTEQFGAIVQASGFSLYDATRLSEFSFGKSPNIVDQAGLEALARQSGAGPIRRPSDGAAVEKVVFVQCAGQRDDSGRHLPYCSGHCCATSIKQAMYFKAANARADTVVIYSDLRVPGNGEDFYRAGQAKGVTFTKGKVRAVEAAGNRCRVRFEDLILGEEALIEDADLVVLATGQVPNSGVDITQPQRENANGVQPVSILNLQYRQGKDLPHLRHGFSDSHFICFPYETRRTGIYAAGPVRRPMDIAQALEDASGAALKAIQAVINAQHGRAAAPRSGDLSYPIVRFDSCTQCKRCTVECPFGAIDEDEKGFPLFNESRCRRCGTCMGACPVRVISFENYSIDSVGAQIRAIEIPDETEGKARILVLACENDAYPALDTAGMQRIAYSDAVRTIAVRCLGSVNSTWIVDALNAGFDGVMLMGCKRGDDYQCHFVEGSELAQERMGKIADTLKQLALEQERVQTYEVAISDASRVAALIADYAQTIERIGPSPMKGFG